MKTPKGLAESKPVQEKSKISRKEGKELPYMLEIEATEEDRSFLAVQKQDLNMKVVLPQQIL